MIEFIGKSGPNKPKRSDLSVDGLNRQTKERAYRLRKAVDDAGGPKVVSEKSGVALSSLGEWFSGRELRVSVIERLAAACDVDPSWLAFGERAPLTQPSVVTERSVNAGYVSIPRYNVQASAGYGALINNEQIVEYLSFDRNWLEAFVKRSADQLLLIEARGDSMEPTIRSGDLLLLDISAREISSSAIHVIEVEGELLVKRLERRLNGSVLVHSDNPRYPPQELSRADRTTLRIVGQVVWQGGTPR